MSGIRGALVSTKFTALLLLPLIAGLLLLGATLTAVVSGSAEQGAIAQAQEAARNNSNQLRAGFNESMAATRALRDAVASLREAHKLSRDTLTALMQKALEDNPTIFGIWAAWEPDALDGKDGEFAGKPGETGSGRYAKYVVRSAVGLKIEGLDSYDAAEPAPYYGLPKRDRVESVVEPYGYMIDGVESILTTFSEPIIVDGKFVGAIGSDINLNRVQKTLAESHPLANGRVSVLSNKAVWLSDLQTDRIGKQVDAKDPTQVGIAESIAGEAVAVSHGQSAIAGEGEVLRIFVPLPLGRSTTVWTVMVTVPVASLFGQAHKMVGIVAGVGALMLISVAAIVARAVGAWQAAEAAAKAAERDQRALEDRRLQHEAANRAAAEVAQLIVGSIGAGLERLAAGDLTYQLETPLPQAYEDLRRNLNTAVAQLRALMVGIVRNTSGIRNETESIARSADDLSRRTEKQARTLEAAASTLNAVTATVRQTAERAKQMNEVVERSRTDANHSGVVVRQAMAAMSGIEDSSAKIGRIIGFVDHIAFETNLLALNAAVEAARAGETGRGFAVVATEVRGLAQRSTEAAKEIKQLIAASAAQVQCGVKFVGETGEALARIVSQVGEITTALSYIAGSAGLQADALYEVNTAIREIDGVTQQNLSMVDQSRTASHVLAQDTEQLAGLTSRFRLVA